MDFHKLMSLISRVFFFGASLTCVYAEYRTGEVPTLADEERA